MGKIDAIIEETEGEHSLKILRDSGPILIPMSKNDANAVKDAFNQLLQLTQASVIQIELKSVGEDLFSQVAVEYVKQLNEELKEIRKDMERNGLTGD